MPGENIGQVLDHAAALRFMNRIGGGPDEHDSDFVASVFVIVGELHLSRLLAKAAERLQRFFDDLTEVASDISGPAQLELAAPRIVDNARLVAMHALGLVHVFDVEIVEPRLQGRFQLGQRHTGAQLYVSVYVYFDSHRDTPRWLSKVRLKCAEARPSGAVRGIVYSDRAPKGDFRERQLTFRLRCFTTVWPRPDGCITALGPSIFMIPHRIAASRTAHRTPSTRLAAVLKRISAPCDCS